MRMRLNALLALLLLAISSCSALRSLQQSEPSSALSAQGPTASIKSNIQLNAPGTSNLLGAPILAPTSGPLPAGVVSLAAQRNRNSAAATDVQDTQAFASTTVPVRICLATCMQSNALKS